MKKLIDNYPTSSFLTEKYSKSNIIDHLVNDKGLISALINVYITFNIECISNMIGNKSFQN